VSGEAFVKQLQLAIL